MIKAPVRAPKARAHAERRVGTVRRDCFDRLLILGGRHLEHVLAARTGMRNLLWLDRGKCLLATHAGKLSSLFVADIRAAPSRTRSAPARSDRAVAG